MFYTKLLFIGKFIQKYSHWRPSIPYSTYAQYPHQSITFFSICLLFIFFQIITSKKNNRPALRANHFQKIPIGNLKTLAHVLNVATKRTSLGGGVPCTTPLADSREV